MYHRFILQVREGDVMGFEGWRRKGRETSRVGWAMNVLEL